MRIQKEIENVERVKDKIATMPLTMEDAIEFHKQVVDRVEKERKEINKELGLDGDIEEKGFTGASKEPKKVSTPELKKMKLSEALFKPLKEAFIELNTPKNRDVAFKIIDLIYQNGLIDNYTREEFADLIYGTEESEPCDSYDLKEKCITYGILDDFKDYLYDFQDTLNEANEDKFHVLIEYKDGNVYEDNINRDFWFGVLQPSIEKDSNVINYKAEKASLNECDKFKKGDCKNYALDEAKISRQNQRRKKDAYLQRKEAEREKAEKEARERERIGDAAWGEKDWIAEREKGDLDFSNYSDEERAEIEKRLKAFDNNKTAQAQYQRRKEAEEAKRAEEERKKAEQEKEERTKKNIERIGKLANAPKDIGNAFKKGLGIG